MKILYTNKNSKIVFQKTPGKKLLRKIGKILLLKVHFQKWPKPNKTLDVQKPPTISTAVELFSEIEKHAQIKNSLSQGAFSKTSIPHKIFLNIAFTLASFLALLPAYGIALVASTSYDIWTEEPSVILSLTPRIKKHATQIANPEVLGISTSENVNSKIIQPKKITPRTNMFPETQNFKNTNLEEEPKNLISNTKNIQQEKVLGIQTTAATDELQILNKIIDDRVNTLFTTGALRNFSNQAYTPSIVTYLPQQQSSGFSGGSLAGVTYLSAKDFSAEKITVTQNLTISGASISLATTTMDNLTVNGSVTANSFLGNGNNFAVLTNGNVGIGTSTPTQALDVVGSIQNLAASSSILTRLGTLTFANGESGANGITVVGKYAYVSHDNSPGRYSIVDVSNPASPQQVGVYTFNSGENNIATSEVAGKYAYITVFNNGSAPAKLVILDISNPAVPVRMGSLAVSSVGNSTAFKLALYGKYVFMQTDSSPTRLFAIDVSDPMNPREVNSLAFTSGQNGGRYGLVISGKYAFLSDDLTPGNIYSVDISNPVSPVRVGSLAFSTGEEIHNIVLQGRYLYVTTWTSPAKVVIVDISNPASMTRVNTLTLNSGESMGLNLKISGRYGFVTTFTTPSQVVMIDISSTTSPRRIGAISGNSGENYFRGLAVSGRYVYAGSQTTPGNFIVYDMSGTETTSLIAHSAEIGNLQVSQNIILGGSAIIQNSLQVGSGGIQSNGALAVSSTSTISTFGGQLTIGTTSTTSMVSIQAQAGLNPFNISSSTGSSLFTILQNGNVGIGTSTPTLGPLVMSSGAYVTAGGTWTNASDRNLKENFQDLDPLDILQKINLLNIQQWNYKTESATTTHIGPIAQDFYEQFHLGSNNTSISTIDPAGVALLGVQGLSKIFGLQGGLTNIASNTPITIAKHVNFSEDTVGEAKILAGQTSVTITFVENYTQQPIVNATPLDFISGAYRVTAVNQSGFTIELKEQQATDITFGWHAFGAFNSKLTVSNGSKQDIILITQVNLPPPPPQTPPPIISPDSENNTPPTPPEENNNQPPPEEQTPPSEPEPQPPLPNPEVTP